jgi:hypothetical protein
MKVVFETETVIAQTPDGAILLVEDKEMENYYIVWAGVLIWKDQNFGKAAARFAEVIGDWEPNGGSPEGENPYLAKDVNAPLEFDSIPQEHRNN